MKEVILCFRENIYAERLCTFIRKYYQQEFRIIGVTERGTVEKYTGKLLLTDDWELYQQHSREESYYFDFNNRGVGINPYQPVEVILGALQWQQTEEGNIRREHDISLIVFYTPGGSSSQRKAALQKCRTVGTEGRSLYIPVRDMELSREEDEIPYDLSELCYCIKRKGSVHSQQILAAIEKGEDFDRLRGFHCPLHVGELGREIGELLEEIREKTRYGHIVLDLQILLPDYKRIFQQAREIYAVEDTITVPGESVLYAGIEKIKQETELRDVTYKVWKWGEILGADKEIG